MLQIATVAEFTFVDLVHSWPPQSSGAQTRQVRQLEKTAEADLEPGEEIRQHQIMHSLDVCSAGLEVQVSDSVAASSTHNHRHAGVLRGTPRPSPAPSSNDSVGERTRRPVPAPRATDSPPASVLSAAQVGNCSRRHHANAHGVGSRSVRTPAYSDHTTEIVLVTNSRGCDDVAQRYPWRGQARSSE